MNNGAACCANSLFKQIVAVCSYFPLSIKTRVSAKTRVSRGTLNRQGVASFGGQGAGSRMILFRGCSSTAAFRDAAQLFHPENIFLLTHRSGTESPAWQVAVFPLRDVPLRPPSKKRPGLSDSRCSNREVSVCSGLMHV